MSSSSTSSTSPRPPSGPLQGIRILEIAGIGPGPFAAMVLADLGAEVLRVDRAGGVRGERPSEPSRDLLNRGRASIGVDLKNPEGRDLVLKLVETADALLEGFRPGVMERLGLGPEPCLQRNPRLVYGRMTGFGQDGPLASAAGHDINYIALAGALEPIGPADRPPTPPMNLVGDFGGGAMFLVVGVLAALLERQRSGRGQVVDAAMVDGAALLMTMMYGFRQSGIWKDERSANLLDGGAPFYRCFETKDGKFVAIGSIEPQFYKELLRLTGLASESLPHQLDGSGWAAMHERFEAIFRTKTRDEWCSLMEGTDVCFAPALSMGEAPSHPHNRARGTFVELAGMTQPGPAPRFSRTPGSISRPPAWPGQDTDPALAAWGLADDEITRLRAAGAIA